MAMATQNFRHDILPPSPTLTNPDMILPDGHVDDYSPTLPDRAASPSIFVRQLNSIKLADAPPGRRTSSSPRTMTPTSTTFSSYSAPSNKESSPARQKHSRSVDLMVAVSSLRSSSSQSTLNAYHHPRDISRSSSSTGSVRTHELDMTKTQGAAPDDVSEARRSDELQPRSNTLTQNDARGNDVDNNSEEDEAEDELAALPRPKGLDDEPGNEEQDDIEFDLNSHTALSKRAEMILANAKKRLNVMEGNLRGARSSLLVPSQALSSLKTQTELSAQIHAARERDRRLYGGIGSIPPRPHDNSPLTNITPGHTRGLSETFTPSSLPAGAVKKIHYSQKRASSALGSIRGQWSPSEGAAPFVRTPSIRSSHSQEQMRQDRLHAWQGTADAQTARRLSPDPRVSPSPNLDTLPEDEAFPSDEMQRSASMATDLKTQMQELKGRISSLKERAKEEGMKRKSLQSLRTPSPFTAAESWYSGTDAYKNGSPIAADAGVGWKGESSPVTSQSHEILQPRHHTERLSGHYSNGKRHSTEAPEIPREEHDSRKANHDEWEIQTNPKEDDTEYHDNTVMHTESYEGGEDYHEHTNVQQYPEDEEPEGDRAEDKSSMVDTESVYEDAEWEQPAGERHEDREDAFDYENFFLHSAMGTYMADRNRRGSVGSEDSIETTRPASPPRSASAATASRARSSQDSRMTHRRTRSNDSISTVQTFATATEGRSSRTAGSDYFDESDGLDEVTNQLIRQSSYQHPVPPTPPLPQRISSLMAPATMDERVDSAVHMSEKQAGRTNSKSVPDMLVAILTSSFQPQQGPSSLEDQDLDLLHSLADSLEMVCRELQTAEPGTYDRKLWRRRVDNARRMLEGDGEGEAF